LILIIIKVLILLKKIRIVCISDTHDHTNDMTHKIPSGDILIHSGDFTRRGRNDEVRRFSNFLETLDFKYKIVIAGTFFIFFIYFKLKYIHINNIGNHELSFDQNKGLVR
jgi:3',5'-cyclic AMP phosphodiesterase CpdA